MDFEFSEDQQLLTDSVRRYLTDRAPVRYARAHYDRPAAVDDVWMGLAELGLTGMLVSERFGGAGLGLVDLALPLGEMGRVVYPGPFAASAVAAVSLVTDLGDESFAAEWLPRLAGGAAVGTVAFTAEASDSRFVHVPDGAAADLILVVTDDRTAVHAVIPERGGVSVTSLETVDGSRKFATVELEDLRDATRFADVGGAIAAADDRLGAAWVLDGIGAAERALELALEYAKEREQFGKPIGAFQAVQHLCADMLRAIELGRAVGYYAAWACDAADPVERHRAATMARAFAADSFYRVAANAIQVFGGIGFTWEHDIHLFYKRLLTLQLLGGSAADHLEELATLVL
jgi:alkylation response protein AidB-like acyl-CoA dehydrogenase